MVRGQRRAARRVPSRLRRRQSGRRAPDPLPRPGHRPRAGELARNGHVQALDKHRLRLLPREARADDRSVDGQEHEHPGGRPHPGIPSGGSHSRPGLREHVRRRTTHGAARACTTSTARAGLPPPRCRSTGLSRRRRIPSSTRSTSSASSSARATTSRYQTDVDTPERSRASCSATGSLDRGTATASTGQRRCATRSKRRATPGHNLVCSSAPYIGRLADSATRTVGRDARRVPLGRVPTPSQPGARHDQLPQPDAATTAVRSARDRVSGWDRSRRRRAARLHGCPRRPVRSLVRGHRLQGRRQAHARSGLRVGRARSGVPVSADRPDRLLPLRRAQPLRRAGERRRSSLLRRLGRAGLQQRFTAMDLGPRLVRRRGRQPRPTRAAVHAKRDRRAHERSGRRPRERGAADDHGRPRRRGHARGRGRHLDGESHLALVSMAAVQRRDEPVRRHSCRRQPDVCRLPVRPGLSTARRGDCVERGRVDDRHVDPDRHGRREPPGLDGPPGRYRRPAARADADGHDRDLVRQHHPLLRRVAAMQCRRRELHDDPRRRNRPLHADRRRRRLDRPLRDHGRQLCGLDDRRLQPVGAP